MYLSASVQRKEGHGDQKPIAYVGQGHAKSYDMDTDTMSHMCQGFATLMSVVTTVECG